MKRFRYKWLSFLISCIALFLGFGAETYATAPPPGGTISITWPLSRSVFQRNSSNKANVVFSGQFISAETSECPSFAYYYKVEKLNLSDGSYNSDKIDWTQFWLQNENTGIYYNEISNLDAGWYDLKVRAMNGTTQRAIATIRFGVGDVFLMAGQSNAQGYPFTLGSDLSPSSVYDCVSVHDYNGNCQREIDQNASMTKLQIGTAPSFVKVGTNGYNSWCYAQLGKLIAMNAGVPTAFFNAAAGGSTITNWQVSSTHIEGNPFYTGATNSIYSHAQYCSDIKPVPDSYGQPYLGLKNALKYYAKVFGIKAVLWHQGESDSGTSTVTYQTALQAVINKSRSDFGSSSLTWLVARASYVGGVSYANVIAGQNGVISAGLAKAGPSTDGITTRSTADNTHIWKSGLDELAQLWYNSINAVGAGYTLFSAIPAPTASFNLSSPPTYPLMASSGYSAYNWNSRSAPTHTTQIASVNGFCYVKDASGNWLRTPSYIGGGFCGLGGARLSAEVSPFSRENEEDAYDFVINTNPVTDNTSSAAFFLNNPSDVRIDVVDINGRTVKTLAHGPHAKGKFTYPLWMQNHAAGAYICVVRINSISMSKRFVVLK